MTTTSGMSPTSARVRDGNDGPGIARRAYRPDSFEGNSFALTTDPAPQASYDRRRHAFRRRASTGGAQLDEAELRRFLADEYPRLVSAVALACGSFPAAEDAVQEALVKAWIRSDRGRQVESLAAWVVTVALNETRSGWRRAMAERRTCRTIEARGQLAVAPSEDRIEVERALAALPRREREVAVLRYLLGFDTKETAGVLGVGEGTVKSSLWRARTHLAEALRVRDLEVNDVEGR
jgi:RNA polymerase sigma-70 factor (ECF subfamily)